MSGRTEKSEERAHTFTQVLWFWFRAWCFRLVHFARLILRRSPRLDCDASMDLPVTFSRSVTSLFATDGISPTERLWQLGKVENLRRALRGIDGIVIPAGATFSFWRQVGPPWRLRGFVPGRELREGCLIPSVGGGLCQLSNALYDCALKAGLEIVERHRHTQVIPGSLAELNRDATIFWNYVDLRFRSGSPLRISAKLDNERLIVSFHGKAVPAAKASEVAPRADQSTPVENCATCGIGSCLRHVGSGSDGGEETAVIVDEFQPEFDTWLASLDRGHLLTPMRHSRWRRPNYAWDDSGWRSVRDAPFLALQRAWKSRRLGAQGATRQKALLAFDRTMASALSSRAPWSCSRAVVAQTLLPHLHKSGWTGGRAVTVLLSRWPIRLLQDRLDEAAARHPSSPTLADFRADSTIADVEWEALEQAEALVTCHARLAEIWPEKTTLLPWKMPGAAAPIQQPDAPLVVFPASGLARKGAIELRDAMRALKLPLRVTGTPQLERDENFWRGVTLAPAAAHWLDGAGVVVLPAWIEHRPRRLLEAIASGVPVITTDTCGLHNWPADKQVTIIPCGDTEALIREIEKAATAPKSLI
jgi:VanW like protein/Glycosyl transferases group 1